LCNFINVCRHLLAHLLNFLTSFLATLTVAACSFVQLLLSLQELLSSIVMSTGVSVCVSVCLQGYLGYLRNHTCDLYQIFLCLLPMSVARSSSGMLMIGRITYQREGGDRSAQRGRIVIYDCLVYSVLYISSWFCYGCELTMNVSERCIVARRLVMQRGRVEDVVVLEEYRGRQLGKL